MKNISRRLMACLLGAALALLAPCALAAQDGAAQIELVLEDGTQQLRLCREHAQLTAKAWGLSDEETYSLWLEEWNRLYAQCVDGTAEDQRAAVAEARDWALLLIKSQRVVWRAKYDRQDAEVEARMARLIVDKCVELCRQMGSQQ